MPPHQRMVSIAVPQLAAEKSHEVLSRHIRDQILSGVIPVGSLLPPERQFAEQSGFGRSTVREAVRTLVAEGLLVTRSGRDRGIEVVEPSTALVRRAMENYLHGRSIPLRALIEARGILESQAAALTASRCDAEIADRLVAGLVLVEDSRSDAEFIRQNINWHNLIAENCGNPLIWSMVESLTFTAIASRSTAMYRRTEETRENADLEHRAILAAIVSGDAEEAAASMRSHIDTLRKLAASFDILDEPLHYEPGPERSS